MYKNQIFLITKYIDSMYKEKYLKYKTKYLRLKHLFNQKGGEITNEQLDIFFDNLSLVSSTVKSDYSQNWALTGSAAVLLLALEFDLLKLCSNFELPNDFDIDVIDMPIKKNKLGEFIKDQKTIQKTVTFKHISQNLKFDLLFSNSTNYIELKNGRCKGLRVKEPDELLENYIENKRYIDEDAEPDEKLIQEKKVFQDELKKEILNLVIKKVNEQKYLIKKIEYERPVKRARAISPIRGLNFSLE